MAKKVLSFLKENKVPLKNALPKITKKNSALIKRKVRVAERLCLDATFGFS